MPREIPKKYRGLYNKRKTSRKAAMRFHCLECCGYQAREVTKCTDPECPLYTWRNKV